LKTEQSFLCALAVTSYELKLKLRVLKFD